jgi:hypothetical protein
MAGEAVAESRIQAVDDGAHAVIALQRSPTTADGRIHDGAGTERLVSE